MSPGSLLALAAGLLLFLRLGGVVERPHGRAVEFRCEELMGVSTRGPASCAVPRLKRSPRLVQLGRFLRGPLPKTQPAPCPARATRRPFGAPLEQSPAERPGALVAGVVGSLGVPSCVLVGSRPISAG